MRLNEETLAEAVLSLCNQLKTFVRVRLYAAATSSQWFRTPAEIYDVAGVSHRRAELELAKLVSEGWLERQEKGAANYTRLVRFVPSSPIKLIGEQRSNRSGSSDQIDRGAAIKLIGEQRSNRSGSSTSSRASGSGSDLDRSSMDRRVRPSGGVQGGEPGTDGRTVSKVQGEPEVQGSDVRWLVELWGDGVSGTIAHRFIQQLLGFGLTRRELRELLAEAKQAADGRCGAHSAFAGIDKEARPLGIACSAVRVESWLKSRARPLRRGPSVRAQLEREAPSRLPAPDEMTAIAELAKAAMRTK